MAKTDVDLNFYLVLDIISDIFHTCTIFFYELFRGTYFYALSILSVVWLLLSTPFRLLFRVSRPREGATLWTAPVPEKRSLISRDGIRIQYSVIPANPNIENPKVMVLACGLGIQADQPSFGCFAPLLYAYGDQFTYITWHYRGLFDSEFPKRRRRLAIAEHAEDLKEILDREKIGCMDVLVGHSMGVQVSLEMTTLYPERVSRLILVNGTHGQVFTSALQPLFRIPFAQAFYKQLIGNLVKRAWLCYAVIKTCVPWLRPGLALYSALFTSTSAREIFGPAYASDFIYAYVGDIIYSPQHTINYLRLFQELDAHSVFHHLADIQHPALVISGLLDVLTPAYMSFEIANEMPNAQHLVCPLASHAALLESPLKCIKVIKRFLAETEPVTGRYSRSSSTHFISSETPLSTPASKKA
eukprot:TRINITY_DN12574_c0_g1::TRINITY_DN12574_c0_g1_i1::g.2660::m.2660 TRINITY_DN12574_c0_g1::TRINITY_DN12574_c0_g1_i1::g.2660  ORF type:complete len:437 (-),score=58.98,sp/B1ZB18/RUTD_METPB/27.21/1e-12,Abhydrolase_6/PF12697.2/2.3e-22,Abhydrolase_1/PF00561.15/2.7e-08,Abhydrolase_5/PF12695.2/1.4e-05,Abhydrolase_4/PF08386.5/0.001,Ser_hydrolase/PF06821.8/0.31 TRINITY_DN12574_c0_g1_i1:285-1526(-)